MRVALYCRVSTTDQNNEIQRTALTQYFLARGWIATMLREDQMSGAKSKRPGLEAIMAAARRREIDAVIVTKLDRFGRSAPDLLANIRELESLGVRFIAIEQGLDTDQSNPVSRFLFSILGAVAELEREFIRERVKAGVQARKAKGLPVGRQRKVFPRDEARRLRANGETLRAISQRLGIAKSTVRDALDEKPSRCYPIPDKILKAGKRANGSATE